MSAITVLFSCLSLAGASVKRKISEFEGAPLRASYRRRRVWDSRDSFSQKCLHVEFFGADFEVVSKTSQKPEAQRDSVPPYLLHQSLIAN